MTKIVYNACFGGFGLSTEAICRYGELKGIKLYQWKDPKYGSDMFTSWFTKEPNPSWTELPSKFWSDYHFSDIDLERDDPILVRVVEELGDRASGSYADLRIAEVPAGTPYRIDEYDGNESVMTQGSYDWKIA